MNCKFCTNYMVELDRCKYCHFEFDEDYNPYKSDDWDILNLDEDGDWWHNQIRDRLHLKGIDCYQADIWVNDMAYLIGCNADTSELARVLNMHEEAIYNQHEQRFVILNLYQEKQLRDKEKKCINCKHLESLSGYPTDFIELGLGFCNLLKREVDVQHGWCEDYEEQRVCGCKGS